MFGCRISVPRTQQEFVIHVSFWISKSVTEIPDAEHVWFQEAEVRIPASGWAHPTDHMKSEIWEINSIMKPAAMLTVWPVAVKVWAKQGIAWHPFPCVFREMKKSRRS